jgi:hypothetical protein
MVQRCVMCDRDLATTEFDGDVCRDCRAYERPDHEEPGIDPRDVPGTRSHRESLAREKGWDE